MFIMRPGFDRQKISGFFHKTIFAAIAGGIAAITYLPALKGAFVWDDLDYIVNNIHIKSIGPDFLHWAFGGFYAANWHPLIWVSLALDYKLWGLDPVGYHITNILLHGINTALVYLIADALIGTVFKSSAAMHGADMPRIRTAALVAALLFGVHPIHVESVAWITERKDVLSALFFLMSMLFYHYRIERLGSETGPAGMKGLFFQKEYLTALGFFIAALLSKPMAVTLPVVLLVLDWYPYNRLSDLRSAGRAFIEKLPFVVLSGASSIITLQAQSSGRAVGDFGTFPLTDRALVSFKALIGYLRHIILPVRLSPFYPYPSYNTISFFAAEYFIPILFTAVMTVFCIWPARRQKVYAAVWLCYIISLVPVIGLVQVGSQEMADRYAYLPSVPPFILIGIGLSTLSGRLFFDRPERAAGKKLFTGALVCISCLMVSSTFAQIHVWSNEETLWTRTLEAEHRRSVIAYQNRGAYYIGQGRYSDAVLDFTAGIYLSLQGGVRPGRLYANRAKALSALGRFDEALTDIQKAFAEGSPLSGYYNTRAGIYYSQGRYADAVADLSESIRMKNGAPENFSMRGTSYLLLGRYQEAVDDFSSAINLDPVPSFQYHLNRGIALSRLGRFEASLADYNDAIRIKGMPDAFFNRGNLYASKGLYAEAAEDYSRAISMSDRPHPDYLSNLAFVNRKLGRE